MPAQANSTKQANLTKYTKQEIFENAKKIVMLQREGKMEEADDLTSLLIPLSPSAANNLKNYYGIEKLIASGMNLSKAVEEYGDAWLTN